MPYESGDTAAAAIASWAHAAARTPVASCATACAPTCLRRIATQAGRQRLRRPALHHAAAPLRSAALSRRDRVRGRPDGGGRTARRGARACVRRHDPRRGEASRRPLDGADADLAAGVELHREIAAATGEAFALSGGPRSRSPRRRQTAAGALLDEALAIARESDVGFHLLDRIYGTRIAAARDPDPHSPRSRRRKRLSAARSRHVPAAGSPLPFRPRSPPRAPET